MCQFANTALGGREKGSTSFCVSDSGRQSPKTASNSVSRSPEEPGAGKNKWRAPLHTVCMSSYSSLVESPRQADCAMMEYSKSAGRSAIVVDAHGEATVATVVAAVVATVLSAA
eukprot:6173850-Pleurochrysis_carterae.AAC.1